MQVHEIRSRKRKLGGFCVQEMVGVPIDTISEWEEEFMKNPTNIITKNTVGTVGSYFSSIDPTEARKVTHLFVNTLKSHNIKATNQGGSGRCWLFAGMNVFRHILIRAMKLDTFEFSETYLFFWDKLERSNTFLQWFIDHPQYDVTSRHVEYMMDEHGYRSDGNIFGWICKFS